MTRRFGRGLTKGGRSDKDARFVQLPYWVMETSAFLALSTSAVCALLFMVKRFNGFNNGKIAFGVRSGCYLKPQGRPNDLVEQQVLSRSEMARALKSLEAAGFIRCTKDATFHQKRLTREWRITWLPCDGKAPTKDFAVQPRERNLETSPIGGHERPSTVPRVSPPSAQTCPDDPVQSHGRDYLLLR
jgi:hypothetical protein